MWAPIRRRVSPPELVPHPLGRIHTRPQAHALRASGMRVQLGPRDAAQALVRYRRPWQELALDYREEVGELDYATRLQENTVKRIRFFPASYAPDSDVPVPAADGGDARYEQAGAEALARLGSPGAVAQLAADLLGAFRVPGEAYLVGRADGDAGGESWEIRSISEVGVADGRPLIRDAPKSRSGVTLGADEYIARLWVPSKRWRNLAYSPVHAAITTCLDALVLLSKEVSATASSRLASAGLLMLDDRLMVGRADGPEGADAADDDELLSMLVEAARAAIRDPGSAEAALPILLRGPAEAIKESKHMTFSRPVEDARDKREWALRRLATVLDLPAELLTGQAAVNHWNAWMIDDVKWRDHLEPGVQDVVHALTEAYYRVHLVEAGVPDDVVKRSVIWYDPTEVIVKSDRSQAAEKAYDRFELSGEALRGHFGFTEDEAPDAGELLRRAALQGLLDPASALALLQGREPVQIVAPPASEPAEINRPPAEGPPNGGVPPDDAPGDAARMAARVRGLRTRRPAALAAAASPPPPADALAASQRLAAIDAALRGRIRDACETSVRRVLDRAGARLAARVRSSKDAALAASVSGAPTWAVPARLGPALVAAYGADEDRLLEAVLAELEGLWGRWLATAADQVIRQVARLVGMDYTTASAQLAYKYRDDAAAGWAFLSRHVEDAARAGLLRDPSEAVAEGRLVPTAVSRAALAIAGGFDTPTSRGLDPATLLPVDRSEHFGQLGTGTTARRWAEGHGAAVERYQWLHGFSENPFPPHEKLDRKYFDTWDDPTLAHEGFPLENDEGGRPGKGHLHPGDHSGCSCDFALVWVPPEKPATGEGA